MTGLRGVMVATLTPPVTAVVTFNAPLVSRAVTAAAWSWMPTRMVRNTLTWPAGGRNVFVKAIPTLTTTLGASSTSTT